MIRLPKMRKPLGLASRTALECLQKRFWQSEFSDGCIARQETPRQIVFWERQI
jgi:hypothetical protein